jgi:hypothetical protein
LQLILDAVHNLRAVIADPLRDVDQTTDPRFATYPLANWWDPWPIREAGELVLRRLTETPLDARECPPKVRRGFQELSDRLTRHRGEPFGWERYTLYGDYHDDWLVFLDDLAELLAKCPAVRPAEAEPTLDCLPEPGKIRWGDKVRKVRPVLWRLLHRFLSGGCQSLEVDTIELVATVRTKVSALNNHLKALGWPWLLSVRNNYIQKKSA